MRLPRQFKSIRQSVWWLLAVLAICSSTASWSAVGYIHEATGEVLAQRGSGAAQPVKAGDTFDPGTTFRTAGNGKVVIKFEDGQLAALQPNTTFRVDQYSFNANNPKASNSAVSLIQGALRFVTGVIGSTNHNNLRLAVGTATVGIRGTDLTVLVDQTTQAVQAAINAGAAVLQTPLGASNIGVGQFVSFSPGAPPSIAAPIAAAPAVIQAVVTALKAAPVPLNTPVIIASAAAAAVAVAQARTAQSAAVANPGNAALQAAAQTAVQQADTAIQTAVTQAQAVLQTAIQSGAIVPTPPAPTPATAPTPAPAPAPAAPQTSPTVPLPFVAPTPPPAPAPTPAPTPPPVTCTGSPC